MTAKSTAKPAKPQATKAKPQATRAKPQASAKPKAAAMMSAKSAPAATSAKALTRARATGGTRSTAKAAPRPKAATAKAAPARSARSASARSAESAPAADPLEVVRPLIRVRQIREFTGKKVTRAEVDAITEVARWSGSSRNEQPCRYIAIRHKDTILKVAELGLPQTRGLPTATAAIAIVEPDEPERENSRAFDDGRAAERILIAANLLGLGGGISRVRRDVREGINKVLGLPANRSVRTIVALGHPTEDALAPKSARGHARLPREQVIFDDRWPPLPKSD